jgi:hypothetical protein
MSKLLSVFAGIFIGIYISQNYDLPNLDFFCKKGYKFLKDYEEQNRKK